MKEKNFAPQFNDDATMGPSLRNKAFTAFVTTFFVCCHCFEISVQHIRTCMFVIGATINFIVICAALIKF